MGSSNTGGGGNKDESAADGGGAADPSASDSPVFNEGERVLAYHGPCLYEAKVQKAELRQDEWRYFVHYLGWSKNWDEWMETDRLLKYTDENVRLQKELLKRQSAEKSSKPGRSIQNKPKGSSDAKLDKEELRNLGARGKKRKGQSGTEEKEMKSLDKFAVLQFPLTLKKQLVDDWEFVTQLGKLVKLPRSPNVDDILKKYLDYRTKKDGMVAESVAEILKGLRCYFDKALLAMLLYKKERQQYHEAVGDKVSPSTIYGAEHFLRLFVLKLVSYHLENYYIKMVEEYAKETPFNCFIPVLGHPLNLVVNYKLIREVKLPELLAYVNMEEDALAKLQQKLLDFLKFLRKNQSSFFLSTYDGGSKSMDEDDD